MRSNTSDFTVAQEAVQRNALQQEILRLGEYMNSPFSARKQCGWDPAVYSRKLTENAVIVTARDENGHIIGLIAAYLNRKEEAFISMLVVEPEYRRCHVAEALCLRVYEIAKERGISRIRGEIRRTIRRAGDWHRRWAIKSEKTASMQTLSLQEEKTLIPF